MHVSVSQFEPPYGLDTPLTTEIRFSSDLLLIPGICNAAANFAANPQSGGQPKLILVLRELLRNAVEHGNQHDASRTVLCRLMRLGARVVEIIVTDEGSGFDSVAANFQLPNTPQDNSHCGLRLVYALSDDLRFEDGGKTVVCRVSLDGATLAEEPTTPNNPNKE